MSSFEVMRKKRELNWAFSCATQSQNSLLFFIFFFKSLVLTPSSIPAVRRWMALISIHVTWSLGHPSSHGWDGTRSKYKVIRVSWSILFWPTRLTITKLSTYRRTLESGCGEGQVGRCREMHVNLSSTLEAFLYRMWDEGEKRI